MATTFVQRIGLQLCPQVLLLFFSFCFFCRGISQSKKVYAQKAPHFYADSINADQLNALSKKLWLKNLDSSIYYAQQALQLSQTSDYKKGIAESYRNMGVTNLFIGDKNVAKEHLLKALDVFSALPDKKGMAATYNNLGVLYDHLSEFSISLTYFHSALTLFRTIDDKEGQGSVLNYIGINYQKQGNYQKAIDYCLQGFEIRKKINDHPGVVFSLINIGNMYLDVGQPQTALNFYNQSVTYAQNHNMEPFDYSLNQIGKTYLRLKQYNKAEAFLIRTINGRKMAVSNHLAAGDLYLETGRLDSAVAQFKISLTNAKEGNNIDKAFALSGLSKVFLRKGQYGLAIPYAQQAYDIGNALQNKLILADVANVLAALHKSNGEYQKAIRFFELAHSITDSVTSENYQRKLAFTESKNEIENQQAHVKLLSSEKEFQKQKVKDEQFLKKLILIVFAVVIILSFIIIRNINGKRKKIQSQKDHIELQRATVEKAYEELKSTQAQLIQREKMASLGELTAGIAHEIQNPLNFINNFSDVNNELIGEMEIELNAGHSKEAISIAGDIKENEQKINHHGKRADAIVKGMLQHSRSSTGQKEPTDINALADEYLRLSYHGLKAKDKTFNATMHTDFDQSIGKINIISHDIGRVLLNLYTNAFFAVNEKNASMGSMPAEYKPTVSVATKQIGFSLVNGGRGCIEIRVKDNGPGIDKKVLDKIFYPFFTTKRTGEGTGLGLSLSYDIIKAHNGEIKVNTKKGEGAEFIIQLPIK